MLGMPSQLATASQERLAAFQGSDVPLRGGDYFQRTFSPFVVLDRVDDRTRLTEEVA